MRQLIIDTETTGLNAGIDRIVSFSLIEANDGVPTGEYMYFFVNPERESHPKALEVHGLTTEFLKNKPKFPELAASVREFIGDAELIAHNAPFDIAFFDDEFQRAGYPNLTNRTIDTVGLSRKQPGAGSQRHRLDDCVVRYGIPDLRRGRGHDALVDTLLVVLLYYRLRFGKLDDAILAAVNKMLREAYGRSIPESTRSESVPAPSPAIAAAVSADLRPVRGGNGQVVQRTAPVHHAPEAGNSEPAEPARGTAAVDRAGRRIMHVDAGPDYVSAAGALLRKALLG